MVRNKKFGIGMYVFFALIAGLIIGQITRLAITNHDTLVEIAGALNIVSGLFMRLIKMIIAPLVFTTLVVGIAKLSDASTLGRLFLKSMIVFIVGTLIAVTIGYTVAEIFKPGVALANLVNTTITSKATVATSISLKSFLNEVVPSAIMDSFAKNQIIHIVVFSVFLGIAGVSIGKPVEPVFDMFEMLGQLIFRVTDYVMRFAPLAVFCSVCAMIVENGLGVLSSYALYLLEFYLALAILWVVLLGIGFAILGKRLFELLKTIADSLGIAFSTTSSESVLPRVLEELKQFGAHPETTGFVIPLGYSFNLIGSIINCVFALMFIIQLHGYHFTHSQTAMMILILMITSKGIAGVSRASLVIIAATLAAMGIPETAMFVIFPIASFTDMGYTATSVFGNALSAAIVDKWERKR
jgi:Na+/H+-dicarboxylate symporter